jgi:inorganic pyrophosphatase
MFQNDITLLLIICVPLFAGVVALLIAQLIDTCILKNYSKGKEPEDALQLKIAKIIRKGAVAFLNIQYMWIFFFCMFVVIFFFVEEGVACDNGSSAFAGDALGNFCIKAEFPGSGGYRMIICFLMGALLSALAGYLAMLSATETNVKVCQVAKCDPHGLHCAHNAAFAGGSVMGFRVVGIALLGMSIFTFIFGHGFTPVSNDAAGHTKMTSNMLEALYYMLGFAFGTSVSAFFARVSSGIYTKGADVGADLVGKLEADFPEDSFYNPATIADNVGDNVADVCGMCIDQFESFTGAIIATAFMGMYVEHDKPDFRRVAFPFWYGGFGVLACAIGYWFVYKSPDMVHKGEHGKSTYVHSGYEDLLFALHKGQLVSAACSIGWSVVVVLILYTGDNGCDSTNSANNCGTVASYGSFEASDGWKDMLCGIIGIAAGVLIAASSEFFTAYSNMPCRSICRSGVTGPATVIIQGLGIGMVSTLVPTLAIVAAIILCDALVGHYGVAVAAVGMLSITPTIIATDAYGPIADNAGGIAEMAHLGSDVRDRTDTLDALGNTNGATSKGFAVGSAVLTSLAYINLYCAQVNFQVKQSVYGGSTATLIDFFSLTRPLVLSGVLLGAMIPFFFSALTLLSVSKAATGVIIEVRHQLNEKPELHDLALLAASEDFVANGGLAQLTPEQIECEPDYEACVRICAESSHYETLLPLGLACWTPITVGLLLGGRALGGYLAGALITCFTLAIVFVNSGTCWQNAKKLIENEQPALGDWKNDPIDGRVSKNTFWHAACVVGDVVGDPFKDTCGPALNVLIKLMAVLSIIMAKNFRNDWQVASWEGIVFLILQCVYFALVFYKVVWSDEDAMKLHDRPDSDACPTCNAALPSITVTTGGYGGDDGGD